MTQDDRDKLARAVIRFTVRRFPRRSLATERDDEAFLNRIEREIWDEYRGATRPIAVRVT